MEIYYILELIQNKINYKLDNEHNMNLTEELHFFTLYQFVSSVDDASPLKISKHMGQPKNSQADFKYSSVNLHIIFNKDIMSSYVVS